jgi:sec-independent protein translocase protein TatB
MLPGLGFSEILVLGVLALLVVGPKDLPLMLRSLGRWMAKLRGMAQEFRTGFDELARQAELDELKREVDALRRGASRGIVGLADEFSRPIDLSPIPPAAASPMGPSAPALPAPESVAPAISTDDPALPFEAPPSPPPPVAERAG